MMKQVVFGGALVLALGAGAAWAQGTAPAKPATARAAKSDQGEGHTAPKQQPTTAPDAGVPTGEMTLGSVRLPKQLTADGKPLPAGTYQLRLTSQDATGDDKGATSSAERWVEFLQGGKVKGREVVTIIPQSETNTVQKDSPPPKNGSRVDTLKGGDYVRVWINRGGNYYLIHLPLAA
jgi:hypothetical protein